MKRFHIDDYIKTMREGSMKILFHIDAIEESNDKEEIKTHIECLQEIENHYSPLFGFEPKDVIKDIREGKRDFQKIKDKCILLGIV